MQESPTQLDGAGLRLRIRLVSKSGANRVEMVEDVQNTSDHPICFALRSWNRRIFQVASSCVIDGNQKWIYHPEPKDLSWGTDVDSWQRIVEDFPESGAAYEGGEVIEPSETTTYPPDSFSVLRAGLYHVESEWCVDILDAREAPQYKVLMKCTLKSNILDINVADDIQGQKKE